MPLPRNKDVLHKKENSVPEESPDREEEISRDCRIRQGLLASNDKDIPLGICRCPDFCPVDNAMAVFEKKWNVKVLYALFVFGKLRFGELQKHIDGISKTMLSSTLKMLEKWGLVIRHQFNEIPPHVEYSLTEGGEALQSVFVEIARWSSKYLKSR